MKHHSDSDNAERSAPILVMRSVPYPGRHRDVSPLRRASGRNILVPIALLLPLVFALGCEQSKLKKVAAAADGFSITVKAFQEAEISAHRQGLVDDAEHKAIEAAIADVARAGLELDNVVRVASQPRPALDGTNAPTSSKLSGLAALDQAYSSLDNLFNAGALHIKNPKARQELQILLLSAKGFLATISAVLR